MTLRSVRAALAAVIVVAGVLAVVGIAAMGRSAAPVVAPEPAVAATAPTTAPADPIGAEPLTVRIPRLGIDSDLQRLDVDVDGVLVPPSTADIAGWFAGGPVPGERGPAVIAGHVDSRAGPGVFCALDELREGDEIEVERSDGPVTFRVLSVRTVPKDAFPTAEVYGPTPVAELRLVTCGGGFNSTERRYLDNVIVRAERV